MTLRVRFFLIFLFISGFAPAVLYIWIERTGLPIYLAGLEDDLVEKAAVLASFLEQESNETLNLEALGSLVYKTRARSLKADIYGRRKAYPEFHVTVADPAGWVVYDSDNGRRVGLDYSQWNDVARTLEGNYGARATWEATEMGRSLTLFVAQPIVVQGRLAGVLTVSKATTVAIGFKTRASRDLFIGAIIVTLLMVGFGLALSFWLSRPIKQLTEYAQAVANGRRVTPPDLAQSEVGTMAKALESMRQNLDGKKYVEGYVQTLTHEIKSPLSAIKGAAELIDEKMPEEKRAKFLNHIRQETLRIQQLIDRLLELSSLEGRNGLIRKEDVDLAALTQDIIKESQPSIDAKQLTIRFTANQPFLLKGELFLLRLAVSNLLQNAIAFAPEGGWIEITFGNHSLVITDNGPGVPDYAKGRIFERFFSLRNKESGRKSSGLGLSIVQQVAHLHQGGVRLENAEHAGARATLWFPLDALVNQQPPANNQI